MSIVETYHIFISSSQRNDPTTTSGDFNINLVHPIRLKNQRNFFYARIGSVEIPYTFQLITSLNNQIVFNYTRPTGTTSHSITIPPGNYNAINILTTISALIQTQISDTLKFEFNYDKPTGLMSFAFAPPDTTGNYYLQFTSVSAVVLGCLGFKTVPSIQFGYRASDNSIITLTSTQNVNLCQITSLYVRSTTLTQIQNYESLVVKQDLSDILAKIQITTQYTSIIEWTNPADLRVKISNKTIDNINLYITNNLSYDSLDLRGLDWTVRITIEEIETEIFEPERTFSSFQLPNIDTQGLEDKKQELINELLALKQKLLEVSKKET